MVVESDANQRIPHPASVLEFAFSFVMDKPHLVGAPFTADVAVSQGRAIWTHTILGNGNER
ncbi:hypothetical protein RFN28_28675 [Mesorhizobium sp. VK24D]|uniref:Uncharacterized protein n=1 Tax=Mesorhizobium album TaxID=3072314 RepID=A0ABU4Y647_9HYPH|nr:hypothetical protein [Mesorhizobium sp. VK24D]MDX8482404.1 hypothetical protein [Mesorhizobium sp. VK24D]